jgi:hypothetical protein
VFRLRFGVAAALAEVAAAKLRRIQVASRRLEPLVLCITYAQCERLFDVCPIGVIDAGFRAGDPRDGKGALYAVS